MPILISGSIVISQQKLEAHLGHRLLAAKGETYLRLICDECVVGTGAYPQDVTIGEVDLTPDTSLYCGCSDQADHDEGVAEQAKLRKEYRVPRSTCVGCFLGDDGIAMHDCYVHRA
jgi:hypothetical protein